MKRLAEVEDLLEEAASKLFSVGKMFAAAKDMHLSSRECFGTFLLLNEVAAQIDQAKTLCSELSEEQTAMGSTGE